MIMNRRNFLRRAAALLAALPFAKKLSAALPVNQNARRRDSLLDPGTANNRRWLWGGQVLRITRIELDDSGAVRIRAHRVERFSAESRIAQIKADQIHSFQTMRASKGVMLYGCEFTVLLTRRPDALGLQIGDLLQLLAHDGGPIAPFSYHGKVVFIADGVKDAQGDIFFPSGVRFENPVRLTRNYDAMQPLGNAYLRWEGNNLVADITLRDGADVRGLFPAIGGQYKNHLLPSDTPKEIEIFSIGCCLRENTDPRITPFGHPDGIARIIARTEVANASRDYYREVISWLGRCAMGRVRR